MLTRAGRAGRAGGGGGVGGGCLKVNVALHIFFSASLQLLLLSGGALILNHIIVSLSTSSYLYWEQCCQTPTWKDGPTF